jgi:L-lactate dehydrogenase complex protein LldG
VDIDLPKLLTRVRAGRFEEKEDRKKEGKRKEGIREEGGGLSGLGRFFMTAYSRIAPHPRLFTLAQKLAALGTRIISPFGEYVHLPAFTGWGYSKDLPRFAGKTFRERFVEGERYTGRGVDRYMSNQVRADERPQSLIPDREGHVAQFTEELTNVNGNVVCVSASELTASVIELLNARQIDHVHMEPDVLDEAAFSDAGIVVHHAPDPELRVGITRAVCGLADTGSILIVDGEGHPLQASLLPAIHIAVLNASDILPSMGDAIALPILRQAKAAAFITGPSRTADIEMSLTIGMHGPGEVHVFVVHGTAGTLVHTIC